MTTKTTKRTWTELRKDPMYPRIKGRSLIRDKNRLAHLIDNEYKKDIQQRRRHNTQRTTILPQKNVQKQQIVPWLSTRQLGRYGTLSKETRQLTTALLYEHKVMRFILSVYNRMRPHFSTARDRVHLCFENDDSLTLIALTHTSEKFYVQYAYIDKKNTQRSRSSVMTTFQNTPENLDVILSKIKDAYIKYGGKLTRHSSYIPLFKGTISKNDRQMLDRVFRVGQKKK